MKKFLICLLLSFFIPRLSVSFADSENDILHWVEKNGHSIVCIDWNYALAKSKDGTFYIYDSISSDNLIITTEYETCSKEIVANKIKEAMSTYKVIEKEGYVVYKVKGPLGAWNWNPNYDNEFYVKTPKGNYYSVSLLWKNVNPLLDEF